MNMSNLSLDEVLDLLQSKVAKPTKQTASEWGFRYPAYREQITEFVSEWMFQEACREGPAQFDEELACNHAASHLGNALHAKRSQAEQFTGLLSTAQAVGLDPAELAARVRANTGLLETLDRREVGLESIPSAFLAALAAELQVSVRTIARWIVSGAQHTGAPAFGLEGDEERQSRTFEQAWHDCGLSDDDLRHWRS